MKSIPRTNLLSLIAIFASMIPVFAEDAPAKPEKVSLWANHAPVGDGTFQEADPMITVHRAAKPNGAAMVICPGGGYGGLVTGAEGHGIAAWLNANGITGIVLEYRLPKGKAFVPLLDAQRAIRTTRSRAKEWGIDPKRIGIIGFSAGGHLAAVTSNATALSYPAIDAADAGSFAPNFTVLIYPAYLVTKELALVPELPVTEKTPPTIIAMSQDDPVGVEGALHYSLALKKAKVSFETHIYPVGGHGYGLRRTDKMVTTWPDRVADWMRASGLLKAESHEQK